MSEPIKQAAKFDDGKIMLELIPVSTLRALGTILTYGAKKYAANNWRQGLLWSRCYGAVLRHLTSWWSGESLDPETGKSHLWHAQCNLAFLIEYEVTHNELDDRPGLTRSGIVNCDFVGGLPVVEGFAGSQDGDDELLARTR